MRGTPTNHYKNITGCKSAGYGNKFEAERLKRLTTGRVLPEFVSSSRSQDHEPLRLSQPFPRVSEDKPTTDLNEAE